MKILRCSNIIEQDGKVVLIALHFGSAIRMAFMIWEIMSTSGAWTGTRPTSINELKRRIQSTTRRAAGGHPAVVLGDTGSKPVDAPPGAACHRSSPIRTTGSE